MSVLQMALITMLPLLVYTEIQLELLQCNNMLYALQLAVADLSWKKDDIYFGKVHGVEILV